MSIINDRLFREAETIKAMVTIYCRHEHSSAVKDCSSCSEIRRYALDRLYACPFGEGKTSCKNCPVHCYKPDMQEEVRKVMRFSGPRMLRRHPILTLFHLYDERRKAALPQENPEQAEESCPKADI